MSTAYIYDAIRTPRGRGRADGALHSLTPVKLIAGVLSSLRDRHKLDTKLVEDIVLGIVDPVGEQGGNLARIAALDADYALTAPGVQINRFCSSGLEATNMAAAKVMSGTADCVIAGGVESMSRVPMMSSGGPWAIDPSVAFKTYFIPQGVSADLIATKYGYNRTDLDSYAIQSQQRAKAAWDNGYFEQSVVPVSSPFGETLLTHDEHMRPETTVDDLAKLKPAFVDAGERYGFDAVAIQRYPEIEKINHVHHAGNSSGIVDGAAAVLIGSEAFGKKTGLKPRAKITTFASVGSEPCIMLTAPAEVSKRALKKCGMKKTDIDLFEINEAFASVVLYYIDELGIKQDKVNVNGGAIAMGHPLGATGAMLVGTVVDELERADLQTALVTLCVGAGMGTATIIERV